MYVETTTRCYWVERDDERRVWDVYYIEGNDQHHKGSFDTLGEVHDFVEEDEES